ncbi:hypothetical protein D6T63_13890 [Arthrobacter cheniae]|uniref:Uncharacterized protein n=1 Tax=Arthrobacter cheniae TaxID=1258888 RepID=A0A3A5M9I6_9MICC|nr:hypothetical protein D6T63_13890 [Arthrobacter cheniae]
MSTFELVATRSQSPTNFSVGALNESSYWWNALKGFTNSRFSRFGNFTALSTYTQPHKLVRTGTRFCVEIELSALRHWQRILYG